MPDHIRRWERGAWGEQLTAKALLPLRKEGWLVRHDGAAQESNLPSAGLRRRTGFEDQLGHQPLPLRRAA
jgi:hypothetical protein